MDGSDFFERLAETMKEIARGDLVTHEDHPLRHWSRACPACLWEEAFMSTPAEPGSTEQLRQRLQNITDTRDYAMSKLTRASEEIGKWKLAVERQEARIRAIKSTLEDNG